MLIALTGCSGGGKSTLLEALAARGHRTVPEPGRRIVRAALAGTGGVLPWEDGPGFARACLALALKDLAQLDAEPEARGRPVFFDRSGLDAVIWLERHGHPLPGIAGALIRRRFDLVLLAPPWPGLRQEGPERQGSWEEALAEYHSLAEGYARYGYRPELLAKAPLAARIARVEALIAARG